MVRAYSCGGFPCPASLSTTNLPHSFGLTQSTFRYDPVTSGDDIDSGCCDLVATTLQTTHVVLGHRLADGSHGLAHVCLALVLRREQGERLVLGRREGRAVDAALGALVRHGAIDKVGADDLVHALGRLRHAAVPVSGAAHRDRRAEPVRHHVGESTGRDGVKVVAERQDGEGGVAVKVAVVSLVGADLPRPEALDALVCEKLAKQRRVLLEHADVLLGMLDTPRLVARVVQAVAARDGGVRLFGLGHDGDVVRRVAIGIDKGGAVAVHDVVQHVGQLGPAGGLVERRKDRLEHHAEGQQLRHLGSDDGHGVVLEVLEQLVELVLQLLCAASLRSEGARLGTCLDAFLEEAIPTAVGVLEVGAPQALVVVGHVDDAVDDEAVDVVGEHVGERGAEHGAVAEAPVVDLFVAKEAVEELHVARDGGGADVLAVLRDKGIGTAQLAQQLGAGDLGADLAVERTRMRVERAKRAALDAVHKALLGVVPAVHAREGATDTTRVERDEVVPALHHRVKVGGEQLVVLGGILAREELEARASGTTGVGEQRAEHLILGGGASTGRVEDDGDRGIAAVVVGVGPVEGRLHAATLERSGVALFIVAVEPDDLASCSLGEVGLVLWLQTCAKVGRRVLAWLAETVRETTKSIGASGRVQPKVGHEEEPDGDPAMEGRGLALTLALIGGVLEVGSRQRRFDRVVASLDRLLLVCRHGQMLCQARSEMVWMEGG
ncbi:hypothetical protein L1887_54455 [Cichorium endivia]|nr:hypothetical protein L1887_54455 [Cichorium endivia]